MKPINGLSSLKRAWSKATRNVTDDGCIHSEVTAGFIIPKGQPKGKREGFMVTVAMYRWSEERMKKHPLSGGVQK